MIRLCRQPQMLLSSKNPIDTTFECQRLHFDFWRSKDWYAFSEMTELNWPIGFFEISITWYGTVQAMHKYCLHKIISSDHSSSSARINCQAGFVPGWSEGKPSMITFRLMVRQGCRQRSQLRNTHLIILDTGEEVEASARSFLPDTD
jgi:hypothetical protein